MKKQVLVFLFLTLTAISCISVKQINSNDIVLELAKPAKEGALSGEFTIAEGKKVHFSKGNLQYQASTNTWRFAEHQWDIIGETNNNISQTYDGWIDLFGWGTSGYHDTLDQQNVNYQPWASTNKRHFSSSNNFYGYGPSTNMASTHLMGSSANYDWGIYNAISNGGNEVGLWRTMTFEEWKYMLFTRVTPSNIRFAKALVCNVNGWIILPDDWSETYYPLKRTNKGGGRFSRNTITDKQWMILEQHGAVFLPAAGYRIQKSIHKAGTRGGYWSASPFNSNAAWFLPIYKSAVFSTNFGRYLGRSVRLVTPVQ